MAEVVLHEVTKKFGDFVAVNALDLRVEDGEFVVLVGPCGWSPVWRRSPRARSISVGGRSVMSRPRIVILRWSFRTMRSILI